MFLPCVVWHIKRKTLLTIFYTIVLLVFNNFIKKRLITKSIYNKSDFVSGQTFKPYRVTDIHLLIISCKTTSSDVILPISLKITLAEQQNNFLAWSSEHLKARERTIIALRLPMILTHRITELEGYSWPMCSKQPQLVDCCIAVVDRLDRRWVLLTTQSTCRGELF